MLRSGEVTSGQRHETANQQDHELNCIEYRDSRPLRGLSGGA